MTDPLPEAMTTPEPGTESARQFVSEMDIAAIRSAHDCSDGGFAVALAECCCDSGGVGADVAIPPATDAAGIDRLAATLFGESATRVIVSTSPDATDAFLGRAHAAGVTAARIGQTGGAQIRITVDGEVSVECPLSEAEARWATGFSKWLERPAHQDDIEALRGT